MVILALICASIACLVSYQVFRFYATKNQYEKHGVRSKGVWPLIGNMGKLLLCIDSFHEIMKNHYNAFPGDKISLFFTFQSPSIMIHDPNLVKEIAIKNWDSFIDRVTLVDETIDPFLGKTLMSLKGRRWHEARSLLSPAFSSAKLKYMYELISECARGFAERVHASTPPQGHDMDVKDAFSKYASDVIAACAFGLKIDSTKNPNNEFYTLGKKMNNFNAWRVVKFLMLLSVPGLAKWLKVKMFEDEHVEFFKSIIENAVKTRNEGGISKPDMLQVMMDKRALGNGPNLMDMTAHAFIFFFAGFEPVTNQISFLAHEIAVNLRVQRKLHEEIDATYRESGGNISYEDLNGMAYLDAAVNEIMRLYPVSVATDRVCTKEFVVHGERKYTIQPGCNVILPIAAMLHDPKYFSDPGKFIPERFLGKKLPFNQPPFIPFGLGPRVCVGRRFALLEIKSAIVELLLRCDLDIGAKTSVPMVFARHSFVLKPKNGWWVNVKPRKSSVTSARSRK